MSKHPLCAGCRHPGSAQQRLGRAGLTLIELMVALVLVGIIAAIAVPSFNNSLVKSRRADAMAALGTMQLAQERFRGNNTVYQIKLSDLTGGSSGTSPSGYYAMSIFAADATSYTLRATAVAGGKQASDSTCNIFESILLDGNFSYASYASGGSKNAAPEPCWVK